MRSRKSKREELFSTNNANSVSVSMPTNDSELQAHARTILDAIAFTPFELGKVIEDILLILECGLERELEGQIQSLPL